MTNKPPAPPSTRTAPMDKLEERLLRHKCVYCDMRFASTNERAPHQEECDSNPHKPRPLCALCGKPYLAHWRGSPATLKCPATFTYRAKSPEAADALAAKQALIDELVDGLEVYGDHLDRCAIYRHGTCDCGLAALISKARSSGKAGSDA